MTRLRYAPLFIGLVGFSQLASATDGQSVLFEHNGSQVRLDVRAGTAIMRYVEPRPALFAAGIDRNTLLFEGRLGPDGSLQGLAYTYAAGCAPASYPVNGLWRVGGILLRGAAPQRQRGGCAVVGYDPQSPQALLAFNAVAVLPTSANSAAPAPQPAQAIAQGPTHLPRRNPRSRCLRLPSVPSLSSAIMTA